MNYYHFHSRISIIHRLDKNSTGLLILAKKKLAAQVMSKFLSEQNNIEKYYVALVEGVPESFLKTGNLSGIIDLPLVFHNKKMKLCNLSNEEGEQCTTLFQIMGVFQVDEDGKQVKFKELEKILKGKEENLVTLMKIRIKVGKKHQIRDHLSQVLKTPVLFDRKYGFFNMKLEKSLKKLVLNSYSGIEETTKINKNFIKFNSTEKKF